MYSCAPFEFHKRVFVFKFNLYRTVIYNTYLYNNNIYYDILYIEYNSNNTLVGTSRLNFFTRCALQFELHVK